MLPAIRPSNTTAPQPTSIAIDFFCGGGGTTRGLIDAGTYVAAGVDNNPDYAPTYVHNNCNIAGDRKPPAFIVKDISNSHDEPIHNGNLQITQAIDKARAQHPSLPLLFAISAPCQPFSRFPTYRMSDPKLAKREQDRDLLTHVARYIRLHLPDLIFSENVVHIKAQSNRRSWDGFIQTLDELGYVQEHQPVNTANFQIPQRRRRIILLAARPLLQKPFLFNLNQSQGGMCICRVLGIGAGVSRECFGP